MRQRERERYIYTGCSHNWRAREPRRKTSLDYGLRVGRVSSLRAVHQAIARARDDLPRVMTARRHAALTIIIIPRNIDEYPRMRLYARLVIDFRGYARGYFYVATSGVLKHELSTRTCTPGAFNVQSS